MRRLTIVAMSVVMATGMLVPGVAIAQQAAAITGAVTDTTGAVLPGVTVEAASPVLIEKVRTAVTGSDGQYRLVDLRPGTYVVTFTLPGFSVVRREGIELTTGFTATVNTQLQVGALEETVVVTGASPVVDIQNVTRQEVLTSEVLEALPSAKSISGLTTLVPGVVVRGFNGNQDVGGTSGDQSTYMAIHGSRPGDMIIMFDGLPINSAVIHSDPAAYSLFPNPASMQEVALTTDNHPAEFDSAGIRINMVPKDGGNTFHAIFMGSFTNDSLQGSNLSDSLKARGLSSVTKINNIYDVNPGFGGKLVQDRLWFYSAHRWWANSNFVAGLYENKTGESFIYTPDLTKQVIDEQRKRSNGIRLTWQVNDRNKLGFHYERQYACTCHNGLNSGTASLEGSTIAEFPHNYYAQVKWNAPLSNRFLIEASWGVATADYELSTETTADGFTPAIDAISIFDRSRNFRYRAPGNAGGSWGERSDVPYTERVVASYITGAHALRFGFVNTHGYQQFVGTPAPVFFTYRYLNGEPDSVQYGAPATTGAREDLKRSLGLFVQDQWTINRLTLNLGLRYTNFNDYIPQQDSAASYGVPATVFDEVKDVPNWSDITPRGGVAYDVFGNGKTAVKASVGKYLRGEGQQIAFGLNPLAGNAVVRTVTRTWDDANGNNMPDCDFLNQAAQGECGVGNFAFGTNRIRDGYGDGVLKGWNKRQYNWVAGLGVQHEVVGGMSVSVDYHRRWYGNFMVRDNLSVNPSDYDPFCVTAPVDARLGSVSGSEVCGLYDLNPSKLGQTNYRWVFAEDVGGSVSDHYDGVDVTVNARLPNGITIQGGTSTGREIVDQCEVTGLIDNAAATLPIARGPTTRFGLSQRTVNVSGMASPSKRFCRYAPPFQTQFKALAVVPLPWGLTTTATLQSVEGVEVSADWVATNSAVVPGSLGRNLSTGTAVVQLIEPGTMFEDRLNQLDLRVGKSFQVGRNRIQANVDLFNVFNQDTILAQVGRFGPAWGRPTTVVTGRFMKVSMQYDF